MLEQWDYRKAGLDLKKYEETISGIQPLLTSTHDRLRVIPPPFPPRKGGKGTGGFASLFDLDPDAWLFRRRYKHPVLVTCTDGVGSKLKIACLTGKYDTVGIDLVAMSVNDLICTGGEPLVFLDYVAMPKDDPPLSIALVKGISDGCKEAECSLVGGEMAILPDFYQSGDFDMAGFATGVVERDRIVDGRHIQTGDAVIGLASSGIHSKDIASCERSSSGDRRSLDGPQLGHGRRCPVDANALLRPHPSTRRSLPRQAGDSRPGEHYRRRLPDNVAILPPGKRVHVKRSWEIPPVFGGSEARQRG